ncbi:MAG: hypothetical protein ACI85Q_002930 [Salibacteraceae bacterium]|jgi:hypothetical protein
MKYQLTTEGDSLLIEHVYAFIDSKLQFINYQIDTAVKSFEVNDSVSPILIPSLPHHSTSLFEKVLGSIESHSKTKGKLLLMRSKLGKHNARLSFDLLTDNRFLVHTEKHLKIMLDIVKQTEDLP